MENMHSDVRVSRVNTTTGSIINVFYIGVQYSLRARGGFQLNAKMA